MNFWRRVMWCVNWSKTKVQVFDDTSTPPSKVSVLDHNVEVVDSFVYLGSCIDVHGGSEPDICRRIGKARSCMKSLDRNIWWSSISLQTKIRLYNVYILPIFLYGADTCSMTVASSRRLDAYKHLTSGVFASLGALGIYTNAKFSADATVLQWAIV